MEKLTEGQIARMRDHLRLGKSLQEVRDGQTVWQWAQLALEHLEDLLEQAETETKADGGTLATRLRDALEGRILVQLGGRAALTNEVKLESLSVHVLADGVIVDTRMRLGSWKQ